MVRSDGLEPPTLCLLVGGVGIEPTQVKIFTLRPIVLPKADALPTELTSHKDSLTCLVLFFLDDYRTRTVFHPISPLHCNRVQFSGIAYDMAWFI